MKPSRLRDEAGTKAETSEQNTSRLSDEDALCQSTQIKYLTFKGWEDTSRLRDEKKPHAGEVRRAQGAEQTMAIGN